MMEINSPGGPLSAGDQILCDTAGTQTIKVPLNCVGVRWGI